MAVELTKEEYKMDRHIKFNCNPVLGSEIYFADVEARVFGDTLYLYGTSDGVIRIVSTKDMKTFTDHGVVVSPQDVKWKAANEIWAPDCVYRDGVYYLYYSLPTGECGVSTSKNPEGPFENSVKIEGVNGIDPAVLIDDDGEAYIYFGQLDNVSVAKLSDDMVSIDVSSISHPLNVKEFGYHEGISIRKIDGKYFLVYTDTHRHGNMPVCQGYAVSEYPTHGFTYKGILIDNFGCDNGTWNNHGCIECVDGKWCIFYHCSTHYSSEKRHLFVEELKTDCNGDFLEAEMTTSGIYGKISDKSVIPAYIACMLSGNVRKSEEKNTEYKMSLTSIVEGDTAIYKYVDFDGADTFRVKTKSDVPGKIELYIDGKYHGCVFIEESEEYKTFSCKIPPVFGRHSVMLRFFGKHEWMTVHKMKNMSFLEFSFR